MLVGKVENGRVLPSHFFQRFFLFSQKNIVYLHQEKKGTMNQLGQDFFYKHPVHTEYGCDENGNVYSFRFGKTRKLKPFLNNHGYLQFEVWKDGKTITHPLVHKFVYECIKGDIPTGYHVDHLDFNRQNNSIENLRVLPANENRSRISEEGRRRIGEATAKSNKQRCSKPVLQYDKQYNLIAEFPSIREAERQTGINQGSISQCCKGKYKTAGGFIWKYKPNNKISDYE